MLKGLTQQDQHMTTQAAHQLQDGRLHVSLELPLMQRPESWWHRNVELDNLVEKMSM